MYKRSEKKFQKKEENTNSNEKFLKELEKIENFTFKFVIEMEDEESTSNKNSRQIEFKYKDCSFNLSNEE